jgi:hypothetical protein
LSCIATSASWCGNYAAAARERKFELSDACHYESEGIARIAMPAITLRNACGFCGLVL